jgi:hypothetical protein
VKPPPKSYNASALLLSLHGPLQDQLISNDDPTQWLVYTLIVRTLRLGDGHALEKTAEKSSVMLGKEARRGRCRSFESFFLFL